MVKELANNIVNYASTHGFSGKSLQYVEDQLATFRDDAVAAALATLQDTTGHIVDAVDDVGQAINDALEAPIRAVEKRRALCRRKNT